MINFNISNGMSPYELATVTSYERANKVMAELRGLIDAGMNPNDADIDYSGIETPDLLRIKHHIESYYANMMR